MGPWWTNPIPAATVASAKETKAGSPGIPPGVRFGGSLHHHFPESTGRTPAATAISAAAAAAAAKAGRRNHGRPPGRTRRGGRAESARILSRTGRDRSREGSTDRRAAATRPAEDSRSAASAAHRAQPPRWDSSPARSSADASPVDARTVRAAASSQGSAGRGSKPASGRSRSVPFTRASSGASGAPA